jgi:hypothetical protein
MSTATGNLFPDPPRRRNREPMVEWTDPVTEEVHKCPLAFLVIRYLIKTGRENARHAQMLLRALGRPVTPRNERHIRQAVRILQRKESELIISIRSSKGGYYRPRTEEDVAQYCNAQEALARSMLKGIDAIWKLWYGEDR